MSPFAFFLFHLVILSSCQTTAPSKTFSVSSTLATLIHASDFSSKASISQVPDPSYNGKVNMRIVVFSDDVNIKTWLKSFNVYDNGVYKKTLYDIYLTNQNSGLEGTNFTISTTMSFSVYGFAMIISPVYSFKAQPSIVPAPMSKTNVTMTYSSSSTANPSVSHEVKDWKYSLQSPTVFKNISFVSGAHDRFQKNSEEETIVQVGSGEVRIYAGCVTGEDGSKEIAVINSTNFQLFENLQVQGRCKTFSVSDGTFQYYKMDYYPFDFHNKIGQKGVIMSENYPYPNERTSLARNYLIQSPGTNTHIAVDYEIVHIANDVRVSLEQDIRGNDDKAFKNFTSSDSGSTFSSVSTFQQYLLYTIPSNSEGILLRYTVRETSSAHNLGLFFVFLMGFLYL